MMKTTRYLQILIAGAAFTFGAATVNAQATRTWVSGVGDDVNPCSRTAPCKTFAGAISKTAEGGEISVLDPGGYGALTITKAITVDGGTGAGYGHVLASGTSGFTVNVTTGVHVNDAIVILRNLTVNGIKQSSSAAGVHGVNHIKANRLLVEDCVFENLSTTGINQSSLATSATLWVNNCSFANTTAGMLLTTTSGASVAHIDGSRFSGGNANGINTTSNAFVHVRNCYFGSTTAANGGVRANTGCQVNVSDSLFVSNNTGVNIAGGTVRLSNNEFYNNTTGVGGGTAESANNNKFRANTTDGNTSNVIVVK